MRTRIHTNGNMIKGHMTLHGKAYDIIKFGMRLRIVGQQNDRSLDCKGYFDINQIKEAYPEAYVSY